MHRMIRTLQEHGLLTPLRIILLFLVVLSLIIILGQFFHQSLQDAIAEQFNKQQLLLAQQVAINVASFIDHVHKDISVISRLPDVLKINQSDRARSVAESIHFHLASDILVTIRILDRQGTILYDSAAPGREGGSLAATDYFRKASAMRRNDRLVSDLLPPSGQLDESRQFIIAVPVYQAGNGRQAFDFKGVVIAVLSLDGITQKFLAPIKSGTRGYAWMMDSEGTLLYHPNQPQMVGKNLYHTDRSCFTCHRSFDTEKKMIEGKTETFGHYEAPGGENKLAAFFRIPLDSKSWLVVVSAPYTDVIALMSKSRFLYSSLIISIFIITLSAAGILVVINRQKIMAEEKAAHLENRRKLEQEVVIAKDYLENIIENTRTGLMVLDRELVVRTINTAHAKILGRSKDDIVGKPFFELCRDYLKPSDGIPLEPLLRRTIMNGSSIEIKESMLVGIHQEPIYLDMLASPLLISGEVTGIVLTSYNVTKRVLLENALKKYTTALEARVEHEVEQHRRLEQQVLHSEKLAALGRLAAGVAHEIGNPLTSISTFAQLMREMATDEFSQNSLDIINNHILRITEIVRQMSAFSRPGEANIKLHQINDILSSSMDLMRLDKRMKNTIEISMDLDPTLPKTMIDEGQIAQVFINIILNALDAMPDGGRLSISSSHGMDQDGLDIIRLAITDTGMGIPEGDFAKIFDPFYTTKEAGKGTGLGLSVSYNIVKRFKGDIKITSQVGKGTTFTIILPVLAEVPKEPTNA